jgi:hypothetical protein
MSRQDDAWRPRFKANQFELAERCIVRVDQVLSLNEAELVARNSA